MLLNASAACCSTPLPHAAQRLCRMLLSGYAAPM